MPKVERNKFFKNDKIVVKNNKTGQIRKLIFPHEVDFGLEGYPEFAEKIRFFNGLSGSLTHLPDGTSYLIAGTGIEIATGSNGAVTITNNGSGAGTITGVTAGSSLSGGGTTGNVTLNLDINGLAGLTAATFDDDDYFVVYDNSAGDYKKVTFEHMMDYATDPLYSPGIDSSTGGRLSLDINSLLASTLDPAADFIAFSDEGTGNTPSRKISINDFLTAIADTGLSVSSGLLSVANLAVSEGGTGATSFADKSVIITQDSGTDTLIAEPMTTNGSLLIGGTSGPAASTLTAGTNISITNGDGSITITASGVAPGAAGSDTEVQFNDGGSALGTDSTFTFNKTTNTLTVPNLSGSLTRLSDDTSYLVAGNNITITSQSNGSILIEASELAHTAGDGLDLTGTEFSLDLKTSGGLLIDATELAIDDSIVATLTGSQFSGNIGVTGSIEATSFFSGSMFKAPILTGSLTQLHDGTSYLIAAGATTITTGSNGAVTISSVNSEYNAGDGIRLDGGTLFQADLKSGGGLEFYLTQLAIDDSVVATLTGSDFSGTVKAPAFSGSLTHLEDGTSYLIAGNNVVITTGSNGAVTINSIMSATGIVAGSDTQIQFNDGGSNFGADANFTFNKTTDTLTVTNLSSSLTRLTDGTSYLVAGPNISITTQSNGSILITGSNQIVTSPASPENSIQFNDSGVFGGDSDLTFNKTDNILTLSGTLKQLTSSLYSTNFAGSVSLVAAHDLTNNITFRLPESDGTKFEFLQTDGAGNLSFDYADRVRIQVRNNSGYDLDAGTPVYITGYNSGGDRADIAASSGSLSSTMPAAAILTEDLNNNSNGHAALIGFLEGVDTSTFSEGETLYVAADGGLTNVKPTGSDELIQNVGFVLKAASNGIMYVTSPGRTNDVPNDLIGRTGLSGSLQMLSDGVTRYLVGTGSITVYTASNGQVIVSGSEVQYTAGTGLNLSAYQFSINDSIVATLTGSQFSGTVIAPAFSGSLTQLEDGTSYLIAGSNITIATGSNGSVTISLSGDVGGTIDIVSGSTSVSSISTLAASDGFILNDEGSGRAALTASIGISEDGDYTDGLFTDFTPQTRLGIAIDRFNEILKLLAPSPAPALDDIDVNVDGTDAYLSFGTSNNLEGEATPYYTVSTTAGFSAVDVNGLYQTATSGNNLRAAIFAGATEITGDLNEDVSADGDNYPANSFGNADQGELRLEINGSVIHTVDLTSFAGSGDPGSGTAVTNSTGSCFTNFSTAADGTLDNGTAFPNFKHRTGRYKVITSDQRQGWNYLRVLHVYGTTTITTNYVEWVNDADANALAASNNSLTFTGAGSLHLSGIEYFTNGSAEYLVKVDNAYRNVYDTTNITFTTSTGGSLNTSPSFSISAQSKPTIDTGAGEDHTKALHITGSASITATQMLSGSITAGVSVTHPLKSNLSNSGQASDEGILIYNRANTSTALVETFRRENYRIVSGAYDTQASLTDAGNVWDSTTHMTASNGGHTNGLQFFNSRLYSPINTLNSGDFSTFSNGPTENPDYSGETGQRTFYRWFRNETGSTHYDFTITINGSATIVNSATALNSSRIRVFVKFPNNGTRETGWLDLATEFVLDSYNDNDGAYTVSFDSSLNATNYVTLGTVGILDDDYIGLRIEADASWTGYIDQITVSFGAGTGTITAIPDLDDIDCNDDGTDCNLSFGASKSITGYTNSSTEAGFSAVDLNGLYQTATSSNNLRQSVFQLDRIIEGDLNEDVGSAFPDYVANSFSDANSGSLALEVNGNTVHTVEITGSYNLVGSGEPGSGTGTSLNGNGSGFFDLSVWRPAEYDNGVPYYLEVYRTGKFRVHTADQRNGWNYARVVHSGSWGARATNYIEWVNDNNADAMSSAGVGITAFGDDTFAYSSGVKFFTSPSGSIISRISNIYKNVYSDSASAISFINLSNASGAQIIQSGSGLTLTKTTAGSTDSLQTLNTNPDSQNELLHVSGTVNFTLSKSLPGSFTTAYNCAGGMRFLHPFKTTLDLSTQTATDLLVWTPTDTSDTNYNEYLTDETYRLVSSSYDLQSDITGGSYNWNSQRSINDNATYPEHATGLLVYDTYIMSPLKGGASGDFRNNDDGGSIEGPDGNPNYTTLTNATREYYRGFLNPTTNDLARITIILYGSGTIVPLGTSLGTNGNVHIELKIPGKTGFLDLGTASPGSGNISDGDGCLFGDPDFTIDSGGATNVCTWNGVTVDGTTSGAEYFVIKISASENWTGYIDRISVTWSG